MHEGFADLRTSRVDTSGHESFWPSFTDIMMVVVMIFMIASTVLVLRNWELVSELRETIQAERKAEELARSAAETSETLEGRLIQAQREVAELRMLLMQAREANQDVQQKLATSEQALAQVRQDLVASEQVLSRREQELDHTRQELAQTVEDRLETEQQLESLRSERRQLVVDLKDSMDEARRLDIGLKQAAAEYALLEKSFHAREQEVASLQESARLQEAEIERFRQASILSDDQLKALQGDYDSLKTKYDKLVRPARTAKGRYAVSVRYWKDGNEHHINYKQPEDNSFRTISRQELHNRLSRLKKKHGDKLYVRVIIPDDSGLSYNEAWSFTFDLLEKYDYYHQ